jgi:hypothetical protein
VTPVHADALPQVSAPYPREIEVRVTDGDHGGIRTSGGLSLVGRLGLQDHGDPVEFRNLFIKTID